MTDNLELDMKSAMEETLMMARGVFERFAQTKPDKDYGADIRGPFKVEEFIDGWVTLYNWEFEELSLTMRLTEEGFDNGDGVFHCFIGDGEKEEIPIDHMEEYMFNIIQENL